MMPNAGRNPEVPMRRSVLVFLCLLSMIPTASARAQPQSPGGSSPTPPLWRYYCGSDAKENWNLSCKITKNTIATNGPSSGSWADFFRDLQTTTLCAAFDNRGGLHEDTVAVLYSGKDGTNSTPLTFFDTIKFESNLVSGKLSWVGTSSRRSVFPSRTFTMRGDLSVPDQGSAVYKELLANGQKKLGEIDATCHPLE
jgi:hypothetical protein